MTHLAWWPYIVLAGAGVGICTGLFGVGGSSVATPVLALLGAPGLIAVASPLRGAIPSSAVSVIPYVRSRRARPHAAAWPVASGIPARSPGRLLSRLAGGRVLLLMVSGRLMPRDGCLRSACRTRPPAGANPAGVAHVLPLLVPGWQARRDRRVRVPVVVARGQARPVVCDLQAPRVPGPAARPDF